MNYVAAHPAIARLQVADSFATKLAGLMFKKSIESGYGLLLVSCGQIHTCFMHFPIDVVYLSDDLRVLAIERALPPWRMGKLIRGAKHVLEMPAREAVFAVGEQILLTTHDQEHLSGR